MHTAITPETYEAKRIPGLRRAFGCAPASSHGRRRRFLRSRRRFRSMLAILLQHHRLVVFAKDGAQRIGNFTNRRVVFNGHEDRWQQVFAVLERRSSSASAAVVLPESRFDRRAFSRATCSRSSAGSMLSVGIARSSSARIHSRRQRSAPWSRPPVDIRKQTSGFRLHETTLNRLPHPAESVNLIRGKPLRRLRSGW